MILAAAWTMAWRETELHTEDPGRLLWWEPEATGVEVGRRRVVELRDVRIEFVTDCLWRRTMERMSLKL